MNIENDDSVLIGKVLFKYFEFEWARFTMYHIEGIYDTIPKLVFRLHDSNNYDTIQRCLENFEGNLKWVVFKTRFSKKENYILSSSIYCDIEKKIVVGESTEKDFLSLKEYKEVCEMAVNDVPFLAKHLEENLKAV